MSGLGGKLWRSYALLMLGTVGIIGWSIYYFTVLGQSVDLIMRNNYRSVIDAQMMKETLERQDSAMTFHGVGEDRKALPQYQQNRRRFAAFYDDAAHNITEVGEPETIHDIGEQFGAYSREARSFLQVPPGRKELRLRYFRTMEPAFLRLKQRCDDLLKLNQEAMVRAQQRAEQQAQFATWTAVALGAALMALSALYARQLSRTLLAPLLGLIAAVKRLGQGEQETEIQVQTGDELELLAAEFNQMTARLRAYREREEKRLVVAKDEFLAIASHELRTPLTSLQIVIKLLAEASSGPLNPRQQKLVRMAVTDADRLDRLTRDLLDLTRLDTGTAVLDRRPVRPRELVEPALAPLQAQAGSQDVTLTDEVTAELPPVHADPAQLARVISNLVDNALRYTPAGGCVTVTAARDGDAVRFAVHDNGEGIPAEQMPHVFERFYQVPGRKSGMAGLGLAIARKIVEAHGGAMGVESTAGGGATFAFTVPLAAVASGNQ